MRALIFGASGQIGNALLNVHPMNMEVMAPARGEVDIGNAEVVEAFIGSAAPDLIINAAAYTAVDLAESEPETAFRINAAGPRHIAHAAARLRRCRVIQVSTDYVFDGQSLRDYIPGDLPNPLSVYGRSKLEGEEAVLAEMPDASLVIRTAWVYAAQGKNFLLTMLRLMREHGHVRVVADQLGSPTAAASVARAIWKAAEIPGLAGILHWTDAGVASWFDFACEIAQQGNAHGLLMSRPLVQPIGTGEYPTPAPRPPRSVLSTIGSAGILGLTPLPWRENLAQTLQMLINAGGNDHRASRGRAETDEE